MTAPTSPHIYKRDIDDTRRDSLSVLVSMIPAGCRVLDLGTGSGALGRYLTGRKDCEVDGITHNPDEQVMAAPHYRRLELLDLDTGRLPGTLRDDQYQIVVCADVLEHLRNPDAILNSVRQVLSAQGRLLLSVPNVAYCGLIAELLGGDFCYRQEGLLDSTHLRFFTRRSLLDFLGRHGWQVTRLQSITVEPHDSEFSFRPENLPTALLRRLLELPDALAYQFIVEARPLHSGERANHDVFQAAPRSPLRHHSAAVYWTDGTGYTETQKAVAWGTVGLDDQKLSFPLPESKGLTGLRLDPADRPGFLHLRGIRLICPSGGVLWDWDCQAASLVRAGYQQVEFGAWTDSGLVLLMNGDDPFVALPIPVSLLSALPPGSCLEAEMSWPVSSDFLALADTLRDREAAAAAAQARENKSSAENAALLTSKLAIESRLRATEDWLRQADDELSRLSESLADSRRQTAWIAGEREQLRLYLESIEQSALFRVTRPLVHLKAAMDRAIAPHSSSSGIAARAQQPIQDNRTIPMPPVDMPVDVIVPVYRGLDETRCCIESVLASQVIAAYRLVVIFDAGPDLDVLEYLRSRAASVPHMLLLENEQNLGFVATVNRGMCLDETRDVVLLNSDTEVANDWLDRLRRAAYSDQRIGSVTPLSNNATICSYPGFCQPNELPQGYDTRSLDNLCARINRERHVAIPTGVGFCMYIRRDCLAVVGMFDVEKFGMGYGEENDFCMRASNAGWSHVLALDTFVRHAGGISFGDTKKPRELEAFDKLRQLHPRYEALVRAHIAEDPGRPARLAIDIARIQSTARPAVLLVTHARGGGTEKHVRELAETIGDRANFFVMRPASGGITTVEWLAPGESAFRLSFRLPDEADALGEMLLALGIVHIHFHHLLGLAPEVWGLPRQLEVSFDYTAHDHYAVCPQISLTGLDNRYCGERGLDQCTTCLHQSPSSHGTGIVEWRRNYRQLLRQARHVFAPSRDTASRLGRYFPEVETLVVEHPDLKDIPLPDPSPSPLTGGRPLRVAVIGALSVIKGADVLEEVAIEAIRQQALVEFHLLGFGYRALATQPKAALTIHGAYEEGDLPALLDWLSPDLVWFPALWPETYSYTLSACLKAGLPIVAPNIGAFPERLAGRAWSWIQPWDRSSSEWLQFFAEVRSLNFLDALPPPRRPPNTAQNAIFCYRTDYLAGLAVRAGQREITAVELSQYAYDRLTGVVAAQAALKRRLLALLVRLRNARVLSKLARLVPLRWQTRLKTWLAG